MYWAWLIEPVRDQSLTLFRLSWLFKHCFKDMHNSKLTFLKCQTDFNFHCIPNSNYRLDAWDHIIEQTLVHPLKTQQESRILKMKHDPRRKGETGRLQSWQINFHFYSIINQILAWNNNSRKWNTLKRI